MTWKDHFHPEETPHIMSAGAFHEYMKSYVEKYDLMQHISLGTTVTSLKVCPDSEHRFKLTHVPTDLKKGADFSVDFFDYVFVCNGHFTLPNVPEFEGRESFEGTQFHMHVLRELEPEDFDDKNVLIVGAWVSGNDLLVNLFLNPETKDKVHPKKVVLTSRNIGELSKSGDYKPFIESGMLDIKSGNISKIYPRSVLFGDGSEEQIDTIIYATGYKY